MKNVITRHSKRKANIPSLNQCLLGNTSGVGLDLLLRTHKWNIKKECSRIAKHI
jgi:hypothetical protein